MNLTWRKELPDSPGIARCENCGEPATHSGEFSEGKESGGRVPICWKCAVTHRCHNVQPLLLNEKLSLSNANTDMPNFFRSQMRAQREPAKPGSLERLVSPLPCPFCGSTKITVKWEPCPKLDETDTTRRWFAECTECSCQGPFCQKEPEVIPAWNKRANEKLRDGQP